MSLIEDALSFHADDLEESAGECVTYQFGDLGIEIEQAVRGQGLFDEIRSDGDVHTEVRTVDWIIQKEHFVDSSTSQNVEPSIGATITDEEGSIYEVMPGLSPTGWRWSDPYRVRYRIHTMLRSSAN